MQSPFTFLVYFFSAAPVTSKELYEQPKPSPPPPPPITYLGSDGMWLDLISFHSFFPFVDDQAPVLLGSSATSFSTAGERVWGNHIDIRVLRGYYGDAEDNVD